MEKGDADRQGVEANPYTTLFAQQLAATASGFALKVKPMLRM
jgi:hypothetical protein